MFCLDTVLEADIPDKLLGKNINCVDWRNWDYFLGLAQSW